jgi:hypothetical protein
MFLSPERRDRPLHLEVAAHSIERNKLRDPTIITAYMEAFLLTLSMLNPAHFAPFGTGKS